jgi:hypothetical protein
MIVIPMAGLSRRFRDAGYDLPKYMLKAKGVSLFEHSVRSFEKYFNKEEFVFIALDVSDTENFIHDQCKQFGLSNYRVVILDAPTRGQAETVYRGLEALNRGSEYPITIFNIDTFRPGFAYPEDFDIFGVDGYLETFIGSGKNWSNVLPGSMGGSRVVKTAEKAEISEFCCTGLYYFRTAFLFCDAFDRIKNLEATSLQGGEFYIAPMYNDLIARGADIRFSIVPRDQVVFCGVPDEYHEFLVSS